MQTTIIVNPNAAAGRVRRSWPGRAAAVSARFGHCAVRLTQKPGEAAAFAEEAVREGSTRIVAIGGDGTLNEILNGLFERDRPEMINPSVVLVYIPAGTGTGTARSVGLTGASLESALTTSTERRIDVGRASFRGPLGEDICRYFINVSSFGSSGRIADITNRSSKRFGGRASFYASTLRGLLTWRNRRIRLRIDDVVDETLTVNMVAVANGRYFGGAMKIAPGALLDDGLLDVVVVGDIGVLTFLARSRRLYAGTHLELPYVSWFAGRRISAEPLDGPRIPIETDGEHPGHLPIHYTVLPGALGVLAPWRDAEAIHIPNPDPAM